MKLNRKRKGFTLVEIMIVVAIIALLATIAVPNFLRVRKRSQATRILEEMRLIEGAKDQWALEKNKSSADKPTGADLAPYVKKDSPLQKNLVAAAATTKVKDLLDNDVEIGDVDTPPQIDKATYDEFTPSVIEATDNFWGAYYTIGGTPDPDPDNP